METQNQDQNELDYFSDGAPIPGSSKIIEKKAEIFNLCLSDPELKNTIQNKGVIMDRFDEWLEWKKETTKNQFELKHVNYWLKAFQNWLEDEKRKEELIKDSEIKDKELWTKRNSNPYTDGVLSDEEIKERDRINREEYDKSIKAA